MTAILIDGIAGISLHDGILRIECTTVGADGKPHPSGTLVIPGPVAAQVIQALVKGMVQDFRGWPLSGFLDCPKGQQL